MAANAHTHHPLVPTLERAVVADVMHTGIVSCPPEASLRMVARMMSTNRIHAVVVFGDPHNFSDERAWGIVSDMDIAKALGSGEGEITAGGAATSPVHAVKPNDPVLYAAELMGSQRVTHLVVVDPDLDHPIGIISTLDVATAAGWAGHRGATDADMPAPE